MSTFDDFMISEAVKQGNEMQQLREALAQARQQIQELKRERDELAALPKEWEGSGYNPQQMGRLVNLHRQLQKDYKAIEQQLAEARAALKQVANCSCEEGHTCVRVAREIAQKALKPK